MTRALRILAFVSVLFLGSRAEAVTIPTPGPGHHCGFFDTLIVDGSVSVYPSVVKPGCQVCIDFTMITGKSFVNVGYIVALAPVAQGCAWQNGGTPGQDVLISRDGFGTVHTPGGCNNGRQVTSGAMCAEYSLSSVEGGCVMVTIPSSYPSGQYYLRVAVGHHGSVCVQTGVPTTSTDTDCTLFTVDASLGGCTPQPTVTPRGILNVAQSDAGPSNLVTVCVTSPTITPTFSPSPTAGTPTFTMTPTFTVSSTSTATSTATPTFTATSTRTATPTQTVTATNTSTSTHTSTATATSSQTATATSTITVVTPTFTATPTRTVTATATITVVTPTFTATPTRTVTATASITVVTATYTETATSTATATITVTATATSTSTPTPSRTATATVTYTATATSTITDGPSPTSSATPTATPTSTATSTISVTSTQTTTSTATPTPTATPTFSVSFSATLTASATPTFTVSRTATASATQSVSFSPSPTFTATATPTPSATQSPLNTATHSPTATATFSATFSATPTATATVTASQTPSHSDTATISASPSPSATSTVSATITPTWTPSQTMVPRPFKVTVSIYNSAGEKVRSVFQGDVAAIPSGLAISNLPATGNGALPLQFFLSGGAGLLGAMVWNTDNDNGQTVSGGTYYVKVETIDSDGTIVAFSQGVSVVSPSGGNSLAIFSPSGELVREISLASLPSALIDFQMAGGRHVAATNGDQNSGSPGLSFNLKDAKGASYPWAWDGLNSLGQPVQSGTYIVRLVHSELGSVTLIKTEAVTLLSLAGSQPERSLATAVLVPQPYTADAARAGQGLAIVYRPVAGLAAHVNLYNLAGELVAQGQDGYATGRVNLPGDRLAGGIYLVELELQNGPAVLARRAMKMVIAR